MTETVSVDTQGISDDWSEANDFFDSKSRGNLKKDQVLSAMLHLAPLDTPGSDDPCPPHIMTEGAAGSFSFTGQGGSIYCLELDREVTPHQATDLAFGTSAIAPPPPMPAAPRSSTETKAAPAGQVAQITRKRKLGFRGSFVMLLAICFLIGAVVMVFGVFSMMDRNVPYDDILAAMVIGGGLGVIGMLMVALALKIRQTFYVDKFGDRVTEDGSTLPFIVMAQQLGSHDADDGGGGYDDDFD